jgi:hypothetical protein
LESDNGKQKSVDDDNDTEVVECGISDRDFEWIDVLNYIGQREHF